MFLFSHDRNKPLQTTRVGSKVFVHLWFGASFLSSVDLLPFLKCIQCSVTLRFLINEHAIFSISPKKST